MKYRSPDPRAGFVTFFTRFQSRLGGCWRYRTDSLEALITCRNVARIKIPGKDKLTHAMAGCALAFS